MGAKVSSGGSGKKGSYEANGDMNVIPFIDILLVLLIIFMVAAPPPTTDVKVDLPPPTPQNPIVDNKIPTVVDIRDDGTGAMQIFVDGTISDTSTLGDDVLNRVAINNPGTPNRLLETIKVRADQTLAYRDVMGTMALLQEKQFQKVSLVAEDAIAESELR
ncbi:MAG: biopolymer transport protein ExbD [Hyphomonadaceae bacterium]|nr:MAG: biopolymer transport protein ExbD [Hyphomonadaceae bacterium]KAF0184828.1 MAG: biopolymer transport protein ExbD [Hyphomonadaceae bacterium]